MITTPVKTLVMLAARNRSSARMGTTLSLSSEPAAPDQIAPARETAKTAPGAPLVAASRSTMACSALAGRSPLFELGGTDTALSGGSTCAGLQTCGLESAMAIDKNMG